MNLTWLLICFQKTRFKFKHSLFLSVRWLRLHPTHAKTFALRLHFLICEKWLSNLNVDLNVLSLAIWRLMAFFGDRWLKNLEARNDRMKSSKMKESIILCTYWKKISLSILLLKYFKFKSKNKIKSMNLRYQKMNKSVNLEGKLFCFIELIFLKISQA